ncbi:hypothetical protein HZ994_00820 [Akkermansiaceae bacterium]|nr:hypothetical protein HZ994_00820 [Akkermansiaceae bacterium]
MPNNQERQKSRKSGCFIAGTIVAVVVMLGIAGVVYFINRQLSDFDSHREKMCLRPGLVVIDEHLRYSPWGMDAAMWSKFTVRVKGIDEVFDTSRVDTSEFTRDGYEFKVDWIGDAWWDADKRRLIGGSDGVGDDVMRVGYVDNGDGTLTIYIFWFEV